MEKAALDKLVYLNQQQNGVWPKSYFNPSSMANEHIIEMVTCKRFPDDFVVGSVAGTGD